MRLGVSVRAMISSAGGMRAAYLSWLLHAVGGGHGIAYERLEDVLKEKTRGTGALQSNAKSPERFT